MSTSGSPSSRCRRSPTRRSPAACCGGYVTVFGGTAPLTNRFAIARVRGRVQRAVRAVRPRAGVEHAHEVRRGSGRGLAVAVTVGVERRRRQSERLRDQHDDLRGEARVEAGSVDESSIACSGVCPFFTRASTAFFACVLSQPYCCCAFSAIARIASGVSKPGDPATSKPPSALLLREQPRRRRTCGRLRWRVVDAGTTDTRSGLRRTPQPPAMTAYSSQIGLHVIPPSGCWSAKK